MYGRTFESMYTGSMRGSGAMMFAVWGYVLTHQQGNRDRSYFTVELNAEIVAFLIGESEEEVALTIEKCCQPDPESRSQEKEGRRLVKLGPYLYEVVNGPYYDKLKREVDKREGDRIRQERARQKKANGSTGNNGIQHDLWDDAENIYDLYPRKVGKKPAIQKIAAAIKQFGVQKVMEATKIFASAWVGATDLNFCPHPATWFGQHRFNDDPATWVRAEGKKVPESNQIKETIHVPSL